MMGCAFISVFHNIQIKTFQASSKHSDLTTLTLGKKGWPGLFPAYFWAKSQEKGVKEYYRKYVHAFSGEQACNGE